MQAANLETLVPGLAEQRAAERKNRAFAFCGLTHTLCGRRTLPLTPAARLELQMLRNAFALGVPALEGDVFVFLWVLSPHRGATSVPTFRQWALRRAARRMDLDAARAAIAAYVAAQLQDSPGSSTESDGADHSAYIHWMGAEAGFWMNVHGGFTLEAYRGTPYLILQQLFRAWQVNHPIVRRNPDGSTEVEEPQFLNASDGIVARWHRGMRAEIAAAIRARTEKAG